MNEHHQDTYSTEHQTSYTPIVNTTAMTVVVLVVASSLIHINGNIKWYSSRTNTVKSHMGVRTYAIHYIHIAYKVTNIYCG